MTTADGLRNQDPAASEGGSASYVVDPARSQELRRSLRSMLMSRRCPDCHRRLGDRWAEIPEETQAKEIAKCCATKDGYIHPNMPMQEIIFREILAGGNQPVSLEQLHFLVTDKWHSPTNPRNISSPSLRKVLDNDLYYGLVDVAGVDG